jgi:hypothetical protein
LSSPLDITALMRHQQRNVIIYLQAIQDLQNYGAHIPNCQSSDTAPPPTLQRYRSPSSTSTTGTTPRAT